MKTSATAKFVGTSARKTGLVAALIRGRRAIDAQVILTNTDKRATGPVGKVLASAIANAENNHNAKVANLMVESVLIGPGPTLKRSSHITVIVSDGKSTDLLAGSAQGKTPSPVGVGSDTASPEEKASVRRPEGALPAATKAEAKANEKAKPDRNDTKKEAK